MTYTFVACLSQHTLNMYTPRVGIAGGWEGAEPPVHVYSTDAHFWVKIGFKFQSVGKISNISR